MVNWLPMFPSIHSMCASDSAYGPLGHEVEDVVGPVLNGRVSHPAAPLAEDLDHGRVQRVSGVDRRRAPLDIVHLSALVGDYQGPFELSHVLGVDAEIGLERHVHLDAGGTYMKEPPDQTAEFSAANLLSLSGMILPKYCFTKSGYSRRAVSMSQNSTPWRASSSRLRW